MREQYFVNPEDVSQKVVSQALSEVYGGHSVMPEATPKSMNKEADESHNEKHAFFTSAEENHTLPLELFNDPRDSVVLWSGDTREVA